MPHARVRHIVPVLFKRLRFSPVLILQGARQTGKSFLVRELLSSSLKGLRYITMDKKADREFASNSPDTFLSQYDEARPLAIDEAQKCPELFDAIKLAVDSRRTPGRFLLLGSTEFSRLTRIRESLTGRATRMRLYPLTMAESLSLKLNPSKDPFFLNTTARVSRKDVLRYLSRGGMPGIFAVRQDSERQSLLRDWIDLTVQRDVHMSPRIRVDSDLCSSIFEQIALLDEPTAGNIGKKLRVDTRRIKSHLEVLQTLFAIQPLHPYPSSTGKTMYFLCDVALCTLLGASFERQLQTWILTELSSQNSCRDNERKFFFYRNSKGSLLHFIEESKERSLSALKIFAEERIDTREFELLLSFRGKHGAKTRLFGLGGGHQEYQDRKLTVVPWEGIG